MSHSIACNDRRAAGTAPLRNSDWYRSLDESKRAAIRDLHRLNPIKSLAAVFAFAVIWFAAGWMILAFPTWPVRIVGYFTVGAVIHALGIMMHEGVHSNLVRKPKLDRWFGFLMALPAFVSFSAYRLQHTAHHKYARTEHDPDEIHNISTNRLVKSLAFYGWLIGGSLWYFIGMLPINAFKFGRAKDKRAVALEYVLMVPIYTVIFGLAYRFGVLADLAQVWLIPILFAMTLGNVRGWAEHMLTYPGHPLTETRTVISNPIVSFFMLNSNYHLEHHLFAAMPWYNLPKLHVLLQDEYRRAGVRPYRSYVLFVIEAILVGVHGFVPKHRPIPIN